MSAVSWRRATSWRQVRKRSTQATYRVFVPPRRADVEAGPPAVVADGLHGYLGPVPGAGLTMQQQAAQLVVAVGEDIRLDDDFLADGAFDGKAAAVHFRADPLDDDAGSTRFWKGRVLHEASPVAVTDFRNTTPSGGRVRESEW